MGTPKVDILAHRVSVLLTRWLARRAAERGDVHGANHFLLTLVVDGRNHPTCSLAHRPLTREDLLAAGATDNGHRHTTGS